MGSAEIKLKWQKSPAGTWQIFGFENRKKSGKIVIENKNFAFYLLSILCHSV
jgi:hypothetical protein